MNDRLAWAMHWRVRLGYPLGVVFFWLAKPAIWSILAGMMVALIGLGVRAAAAGMLRKQEELATSGIYARTRNPLYLGSAILALGMVIAGNSWVAAALVAAYFGIFYSAVMKRESRELLARFGDDYRTYAARVPLFLPKLLMKSSSDPAGAKFSWSQYANNREWRSAVGTVIVVGCLLLRMYWP